MRALARSKSRGAKVVELGTKLDLCQASGKKLNAQLKTRTRERDQARAAWWVGVGVAVLAGLAGGYVLGRALH